MSEQSDEDDMAPYFEIIFDWWLFGIIRCVEMPFYLLRGPGIVLAWSPDRWWHLGLMRFLHWEFRP